MSGYIYVISLREFLTTKQDVYKVGRTKDLLKRIQAYPKGSKLIFAKLVENEVSVERKILNNLKLHFIHRKEYGKEYFEGACQRICNFVEQETNVACPLTYTHNEPMEIDHVTKKRKMK